MKYEFRAVEACDMCGGRSFKLLGMRLSTSQGRNPRSAEGIAVPVKRCRCGLVFADPQPIPEDIADHYGIPAEEYWSPEHFTWTPEYFALEIDTAKRLIPFQPGMTALDIGVGVGLAMTSLSRARFDTFGLEPSAPFRDKAIAAMGLDPERIQLSTVEAAEFAPESFDFITFGAVLEHLYSPSAALAKALRWLKPGGIIQAEVPSSNWLVARLVNSYFRLRGTNYVTHLSPMHSPFHLYEFGLDSFARYNVVEHHYGVCTVTHIPGPLKPLFRWYMDRTNTGMQLTVYLKKS